MKKPYKIIGPSNIPKLFLLIVGLFIITSCDKDDDQSPVDKLPPITQSGAQTFGCLINGKPFIPSVFGSNSPRAFYQYVRGAYTLGISAGSGGGHELITILFGGIDIPELNEKQYSLIERKSGNHHAEYLEGYDLRTETKTNNPGVLNITKFDQDNFIISGTFSFNFIDENGEEINITDGRFDLNFTN